MTRESTDSNDSSDDDNNPINLNNNNTEFWSWIEKIIFNKILSDLNAIGTFLYLECELRKYTHPEPITFCANSSRIIDQEE